MQEQGQSSIKVQWVITLFGVLIFTIKIAAWYYTKSVSILTDALESTVNIISAFLGLYSLYLSAKPKDYDHPYGHGKIEFLTSAIEGSLIFMAGLIIIYESIIKISNPQIPSALDLGIILIGITAILNFILGTVAVKVGRKNNSLALVSSGKHLQSDTYTTLGIIIGLLVIYFSKIYWLDSLIALIFAFIILRTGYKIIRESIAGIMDEADEKLLNKLILFLEEHRNPETIDLHNLRIIKYGSRLHLDCHITVPYYYNVDQAHEQVDRLEKIVAQYFGASVELFVHVDGCIESSCSLCLIENCLVRKHAFKQRIVWNIENISSNQKHRLE